MYRIMVVEDDQTIAFGMKKFLESWNYQVICVEEFQDIMKSFQEENPDIILMDLMLPYFNGFYWCEQIRRISKVPIMFLSSASDNMNIIMAVNMGGDDFIPKPFDLSVLTAKVQAVLRRTYDLAGKIPVLEHRGAILNLYDTTLTFEGRKISLTKNEFRILQTLMENKGRLVSRETLMTRLWETDNYIEENTLTVNIARLRKKLEKAGLKDFITTKVGEGYIIQQL